MIQSLPPELTMPDGARYASVDECTSRFRTDMFLWNFDALGAEWLIFTLGQNTGLYNSPNRVLESVLGAGHCSRRDLARELAEGLKGRGKRFIAYLPLEAHCNDTVRDLLRWDSSEPGVCRQDEFQKLWRTAVREWSLRFGPLIDGWFFDGMGSIAMTEGDAARLMEAARAGNPNAAVSFNSTGFDLYAGTIAWPGEDFFSGEATMLKDGLPLTRWREYPNGIPSHFVPAVPGTELPGNSVFHPYSARMPGRKDLLCHVLAPIDAFWWRQNNVDWLNDRPESRYIHPETLPPGEMEPPMYSAGEIRRLISTFTKAGGAVTMNLGVFTDGSFGEKTVKLLLEATAEESRLSTNITGTVPEKHRRKSPDEIPFHID